MKEETRKKVLDGMAANLRSQDNRATSDPVYVVQQRYRHYMCEGAFDGDNETWQSVYPDYEEAPAELLLILWAKYEQNGDSEQTVVAGDIADEALHGEWQKVSVLDTWEFVTAFFTQAGADRYIEENAHNLTDPRVYVASAYRNHEWQAVRATLMEGGEL